VRVSIAVVMKEQIFFIEIMTAYIFSFYAIPAIFVIPDNTPAAASEPNCKIKARSIANPNTVIGAVKF